MKELEQFYLSLIALVKKFFELIKGFNNITEFVLFGAAIYAIIFLFTRLYYNPIKSILYPIGINRKQILRVIVISRKNPSKYIRLFIEFALICTEGECSNTDKWDDIIRDFSRKIISDDQENDTIELPSCFVLLNESFQTIVQTYFTMLSSKKNKKIFRIDNHDTMSFLSKIRIREGYLLPALPIYGIMRRYDENWDQIINKYKNTVRSTSKSVYIRANELFFSYAWLIWGPSTYISQKDSSMKVMLYAIGDECNALTVVLNNDDVLGEWDKQKLNNDINGVFASVIGKLFYDKDFVSKNGHCIGSDAYDLLKRNTEIKTMHHTYFQVEKITPDNAIKEYYCTAYIWMMFEAVSSNEDIFDYSRTLTFFEHANFADSKNFDFMAICLVNKVITFFSETLMKEDRVYRFCRAFHPFLIKLFIEKLDNLAKTDDELARRLKNNIIIGEELSLKTLLESIDNYFGDRQKIDYIKLNSSDEKHLEMLGSFYTGIYMKNFNINERESIDNIIHALEQTSYSYNIVLAIMDNKAVGGVIYDYFPESGICVIEFIVVDEQYRNQGIARGLYEYLVNDVQYSKERKHNSKLGYIFAEVEHKKISHNNANLKFWDSMGFSYLDFKYVQPALEHGKEDVSNLNLIVKILDGDKNYLASPIVEKFIDNYARHAMRIQKPLNNKTVKNMVSDLKNRDKVYIKEIE